MKKINLVEEARKFAHSVHQLAAIIVGAVLADDVKTQPENLGLVTPHTLEVIAAQAGITVGEMRKMAKANARAMKEQVAGLIAEIQKKQALANELSADVTEITAALEQLNKATGKR